jgi:glyoxylate carboligase
VTRMTAARAAVEILKKERATGLSQIQAAQLLHVQKPRHWINAGQAGPLGWTVPAALGVAVAEPTANVAMGTSIDNVVEYDEPADSDGSESRSQEGSLV